MPTLALHIAIAFLGKNVPSKTHLHLKIAYALTFVFLVLVWTSSQFISGVYEYSWGYFPKGGPIHKIHIIFVMATALFGVYLLAKGMMNEKNLNGKTQRYYETKYLFLSMLFVTLGAVDFLPNMGIDIFPPGFIFVTIFVYATTYGIFRHNLMGVSIVIKKSLVYSILISTIIALYFVAIYLAGVFLKDWAKIQSLPIMLILLTTITLVSRPLEQKITDYVDKLFFKKSRELMEKENQLLYLEVQKQDHLKAVALFASGMAHEIKNPLAAIKTFAEYLPKKYEDADFRQKFQKMVVEEVDRINDIVKQLLDFSKPQPLKLGPVDLSCLLDETLAPMSSTFLKHKVSLIKNLGQAIVISADKNQLKQVFLNLFLNAVQAMSNGGVLTVNASTNDKALFVTVSDTGIGISEEQLVHIFEPFYTTKESGTGLGLSIVREIVNAHGGKIWAESKPGIGTHIHLSFPNTFGSNAKQHEVTLIP